MDKRFRNMSIEIAEEGIGETLNVLDDMEENLNNNDDSFITDMAIAYETEGFYILK